MLIASPAHSGQRLKLTGKRSPRSVLQYCVQAGQPVKMPQADLAASAVSTRLTTEATTLTQAANAGPATNAALPAATATTVVVKNGRRHGTWRSHHSPVCTAVFKAFCQRLPEAGSGIAGAG